MTALEKLKRGLRTFANDVGEGFFAITHNGLALLGLVVFCAVMVLTMRPDLRQTGEARLISWLQERQDESDDSSDVDAVDRATATDPRSLPKQQANIAYWLSRKYRVAPEPISALVAEAYDIGQQKRIDPTLILAVMAIESSFNPFAQSTMGAQGLMQVRTEVHTDKYDNFGGDFAAFDPVANLRVGVEVLREAIQRNGGIEAGLRQYVGAALSGEDGGYVNKVLAEQQRIKDVAHGKQVSTQTVKPNEEDGLVELWDKAKSLAPFKENPSKP